MPDQDNAPSAPQSATAPAAGDEEPTTPAGLRKILSQTEQELQELRQDAERVSAKVQEFVRKTKDVEKVQADAYNDATAALAKIKKMRKFAQELTAKGAAAKQQHLEAQLTPIEAELKKFEAVKFATGSSYIRFMLGHVNVKAFTVTERNMLRDEYNKFRDRTNIIFFTAPLFIAFLHTALKASIHQIRWIHVIFYVWMLYYFVTLALRENILFVNGSRIPNWSFTHHYVSAIGSVIMLCWPNGPAYQQYYMKLVWYSILQGAMQFVRSHYQKRRYYTLRSLGKVSSMDVSHEDTIREAPRELMLLIPFIFVVQVFQVYMGICLLWTAVFELDFRQSMKDYQEEVQTMLLGIMFLFLGVGNFVVTFKALSRKTRKFAAARRRRQGNVDSPRQ